MQLGAAYAIDSNLAAISGHGLWGPYPGGGYYDLFHITRACSALDWADKNLFGSLDSQRFVKSPCMQRHVTFFT